ncbi:MAG: hypothetical protein K0Q57_207 [Gammaproteobacteria bacterium]|nr:hypothetical protein [Gammaproteobacteria bacterium]
MQGFIFPAYLKDADKKHLTQLVRLAMGKESSC